MIISCCNTLSLMDAHQHYSISLPVQAHSAGNEEEEEREHLMQVLEHSMR